MATCDDLWLGGTLSSSGITGGTSINSTALAVGDWSDVLGQVGMTYTPLAVSGRPGSVLAGDGLGRPRFLTLNMTLTHWGPNGVGTLVQPTRGEQIVANTDTFLGLLAENAGNYLEIDLPDGTSRFTQVWSLDSANVLQQFRRTISAPMFAPWPYWQVGGQESTDTISGADTMTVGGNVDVYDAVLVFAGDGTFTHSGLGWSIEVTGSGGAVTVDLGDRTVTEGGNPATNRIRRNNRDWGWFTPGSNSVTSDVSVTVTWRDQYE